MEFINLFNDREKALMIWILVILIYSLFNKNIRESLLLVLKSLFLSKIAFALFAMLIYIWLSIFLLFKIQFWGVGLLRDTILWVLGTAFVIFINFGNASKDKKYFKKITFDSIKLIALIEFITNLYVFNLITELILLPILFSLTAMFVISKTKGEYQPVRKLMQIVLTIIGLGLFAYAVLHIATHFTDFATIETLKDFLLSPILTIILLPFIYFLALYSSYESLFVRVDIFMKNKHKQLRKFTKLEIFKTCLFDLGKLNRLSNNALVEVAGLENKTDVINLVNKFRASDRTTLSQKRLQ
jgi:hypothetical protein